MTRDELIKRIEYAKAALNRLWWSLALVAAILILYFLTR